MLNDLEFIFVQLECSYAARSIARELSSRLMASAQIGRLELNIPAFAAECAVHEDDVWSVISAIEATDFWTVDQQMTGAWLVSTGIMTSAKAIAARRKKVVLKGIKLQTAVDRANSLRLSDIGSVMIDEVVARIPRAERDHALRKGYQGWLPSNMFGIDGTAFKPDQKLLSGLSEQFSGIDMAAALAMMFEDLKLGRARPAMPAFSHWMKRWLIAKGSTVATSVSDDEMLDIIKNKGADY